LGVSDASVRPRSAGSHGAPLIEAKNGVHLGGHHRPNRWDQEGGLAGRAFK